MRRRVMFIGLFLLLLMACGAPANDPATASSVLDTWATAVIQGDYSAAEPLMAGAPVSLSSWRTDTEHWRNGSRNGMASYTVLEGPTQAGEALSYMIQWNYKNQDPLWSTLCQKVQVAGEKVTVLTDYKSCKK